MHSAQAAEALPSSKFLYHVRFSPPLKTRHYDHLGERVLVGWMLITDRPLPSMAPFTLQRREAYLTDLHRVTVERIPSHRSDGSH
eukprot:3142134-Prymnesium_polylepis.1